MIYHLFVLWSRPSIFCLVVQRPRPMGILTSPLPILRQILGFQLIRGGSASPISTNFSIPSKQTPQCLYTDASKHKPWLRQRLSCDVVTAPKDGPSTFFPINFKSPIYSGLRPLMLVGNGSRGLRNSRTSLSDLSSQRSRLIMASERI